MLGPVPAGEVTVRAVVERPGRSIALLAAELTAGGRAVLRARAWRLAAGDTAAVATAQDDGPSPHSRRPTTARLRTERPPGWLPGFIDALEWRWVHGWLGDPGPGTVWALQRVPLVDGEEPTPLQRLMLVADSGNGAAAPLDIREWLFVNTELTVHLHRPPVGDVDGRRRADHVGPVRHGHRGGPAVRRARPRGPVGAVPHGAPAS